MEQTINQHEWVKSYTTRWKTCIHCKTDRYSRRGQGFEYHVKALLGKMIQVVYDEPPCINRTTAEEAETK